MTYTNPNPQNGNPNDSNRAPGYPHGGYYGVPAGGVPQPYGYPQSSGNPQSPGDPQSPWRTEPPRGNYPYGVPYQSYDFRRAKSDYSRVGGGLCALLGLWVVLNTAISALLYYLVRGIEMPVWLSFLLSDFPLFCIAMPVAVLIMQRVKPVPTQRYGLSFGRFCVLLIMCVPLIYGGSIIGQVLAALFSRGTAQNRIDAMLEGSNVWVTILFVVVLAPIMEEWFFRKQLISRLRVYGEKTAILVSALAFGLFHLNLYQFFYAFALGLMFGYVYTRTSCLRYSVLMHAIINFNGSVVSTWLLDSAGDETMKAIESDDLVEAEAALLNNPAAIAISLYSVLMLGLIVAGIVLLIVKRKSFEFYPAPREVPHGFGGKVAFLNVGMAVYFVLTIAFTLIEVFI